MWRVEAAVAWVGPAFEIVGTRLESGLAGAGMLAIADGGANIDFVHSPPGAAWRDVDLTAHPVTRRINGVEVASGHSRMLVFGDPVSGVAREPSGTRHPGSEGWRRGDDGHLYRHYAPLAGRRGGGGLRALGTVRARFLD